MGNSAGVIALVYNGFNSFIGYTRGKHDSVNSIVAGGLSGMIFKSTRGIRPMMISGGIVATVAGAWAVSDKGNFMQNQTLTCDYTGYKKGTFLDIPHFF